MPPPRPRRKARTKKKAEDSGKQEKLMEEAKHDPKWFSSCRKLEEPALFQVEGTSDINCLRNSNLQLLGCCILLCCN